MKGPGVPLAQSNYFKALLATTHSRKYVAVQTHIVETSVTD